MDPKLVNQSGKKIENSPKLPNQTKRIKNVHTKQPKLISKPHKLTGAKTTFGFLQTL